MVREATPLTLGEAVGSGSKHTGQDSSVAESRPASPPATGTGSQAGPDLPKREETQPGEPKATEQRKDPDST